jgi:hypothetical protein
MDLPLLDRKPERTLGKKHQYAKRERKSYLLWELRELFNIPHEDMLEVAKLLK